MAQARLGTKTDLTQEEVRALFTYEPHTGLLYWNNSRYKRHKAHQAGHTHNKGYRQVCIREKEYLVHRIIWLYEYGEHPPEIDHINGVRNDNRLCNLRAVSRVGNQHNAAPRSDNSSGTPGVNFSVTHERWVARISFRGFRYFLGSFLTKEEAVSRRLSAEKLLEEVDTNETNAWRISETTTERLPIFSKL